MDDNLHGVIDVQAYIYINNIYIYIYTYIYMYMVEGSRFVSL